MAQVRLINRFGHVAGWNNVSVKLFGRMLEGIVSVEYGDEQDQEVVYGAGGMPIGKGTGNYKAKASIELTKEEIVSILESMPPGMRAQEIPDFNITVAYEYQNRTYKDVIRNCSFKNLDAAAKQGDKSLTTKLDLIPTHIDWNV